jgi:RNA polymerase sigma-70 factor, ECF subfamily
VDRELVERARGGDREAYELLARATARPLYLVAHRILRDSDAADDAVQQALVSIWRELPRLRDPERFQAWSFRVVVRAALAEGRRGRRDRQLREVAREEAGSEDSSRSLADRDLLERAFRTLSAEHRTTVVLHHYLGLSLGEVASAMAVPYGTAASRLHYALRRLRLAIGEDESSTSAASVGATGRTT